MADLEAECGSGNAVEKSDGKGKTLVDWGYRIAISFFATQIDKAVLWLSGGRKKSSDVFARDMRVRWFLFNVGWIGLGPIVSYLGFFLPKLQGMALFPTQLYLSFVFRDLVDVSCNSK